MNTENIKTIYDILPDGWREAAKITGALQRGRKITTPEELLQLILLYQTNGESYGLTAALTQISENQQGLNKTAVQKRIIKSKDWLKWMTLHLCQEQQFLTQPPQWLQGYRVCVVDATDFSKQGSKNADMRFHYLMELFTLNTVEQHFTQASEGEKLSRYKNIQEKDIVIADRVYGTIQGMEHMRERKGDYILRFRANAYHLYTENGEKYDLTEHLKQWEEGKILDKDVYYKVGKAYYPVRICAIGKTVSDIEKSHKHIQKSNKKKNRGEISDIQQIYSRHVVVMTSLPNEISAEKILELYRMRWEIEMVFKRFKSIFHGGELRQKREDAIEAWFYGKLLLAGICEALVKQGRFSP